MNRRQFLARAAAASVAFGAPLFVPRHVLGEPGKPGANDRIRVGFIGVGGRARAIIKDEWSPSGQIVAVADCFLPRCHETAAQHPEGAKWAKYQDYRRMLDREKLDAVFVETTTHARVLICIHAMQAGCDTYVEKPQSLALAEGRVLVKAAHKYKRVVQTGSQQRSMPINRHASQLVRDGAIGKTNHRRHLGKVRLDARVHIALIPRANVKQFDRIADRGGVELSQTLERIAGDSHEWSVVNGGKQRRRTHRETVEFRDPPTECKRGDASTS